MKIIHSAAKSIRPHSRTPILLVKFEGRCFVVAQSARPFAPIGTPTLDLCRDIRCEKPGADFFEVGSGEWLVNGRIEDDGSAHVTETNCAAWPA